jgi:chromosome partitioning protein
VAVSDVVLIPVQPTVFDLSGTVEFMDAVEGPAESGNVRPAFVASRRVPRTRLSAQLSSALEPYGVPVLDGTVQRVAYAYAVQDGPFLTGTAAKRSTKSGRYSQTSQRLSNSNHFPYG